MIYRPSTRRRAGGITAALACLLTVGCQRSPEIPAEPVRIVAQVSPLMPRRVTFSPTEEDRLVVVELSGLVGVWDVADPAKPELTASIPSGAIEASFAPDGRGLVTVGTDGHVRSWGLDGRLNWVSATGHTGPARAVAVGTDTIASGGEDGTIRLWRTADGSALGEPIPAHEGPVVSLAISPQGHLASVGADNVLRLWKRSGAQAPDARATYEAFVLFQAPQRRLLSTFMSELRLDVHCGFDHSVAFSPSGDLIAAAVFDGVVRIYALDGSERGVAKDAHRGRNVRGIAFAPRGDLVASAGWDSTLRFWNLDATRHGQPVEAHLETVFTVSFSAAGDHVATTGLDDRVRLWTTAGLALGELPAARQDRISAVALAPQAPVMAVGDSTGTVRLWNLDGSVRGKPMVEHKGAVQSLAFSPRGDQLASGSDRMLRLWSLDGTPRATFPPQGDQVLTLAFSPSGDLLLSGSDQLRGWRANRLAFQLPGGGWDFISAVAFSPKGDAIATGSRLGRIQVLNADGTARTEALKLPKEYIRALAFSADGQFFATTGGDESVVKLWNLDLSPRGQPLAGHFGRLRALAFAPAGNVLVSGGDDGTVRLWKLATGETEILDVGVPVNQLGFWNELLWVRADGESIFFFDKARKLVATTLLRHDAILTFTPEGWYSGPQRAERVIRAFRASGERLSDTEILTRSSAEKVRLAFSQ